MPSCLNCEKAKRKCPGYRDQLDLLFLDETSGVTNKAQKASLTTRPSSTATAVPSWNSPDLQKSLSAGDSPRSLTPNLDAEATAFFFEHFAIDENLSMQYQLYTESLTETSPGLEALTHSTRALGLAGLSRFEAAPHLSRLAESQYLDAIRAMNSALQDPEIAKKDYTLLAVMILTAFENIAGTDGKDSLAAWSNHVKGAAALLAARGPEQFQTDDGVRMFVQAALPVIVNCISQGMRVDETIMTLYQDAKQCADQSDLAWKMFEHKLLFADFFGQVRQKMVVDPILIVQQAAELDEVAVILTQNLQEPGPWAYRTIQTEETNEIVPLGLYHVYSYFFCAEMWNGLRTLRIILNQMIRSMLLLGFATRPPLFTDQVYTLMFQQVTDNLLMLQNEVVASVPQYFGYGTRRTSSSMGIETTGKGKEKATVSQSSTRSPTPTSTSFPPSSIFPRPSTSVPPSTSPSPAPKQPQFLWSHFPQKRYEVPTTVPTSQTSLPIIRAGGGAHLPWVLFVLGTTDIATQKLRDWCIARLKTIGNEMCVQQALVLAEKLESGRYVEMEAWYRKLWEGVLVVGGSGGEERGRSGGSSELS